MQWLLVQFDGECKVLIDDLPNGNTNETLQLEGGPYRISLDSPQDFEPAYQDIVLEGTDVTHPMVVTFTLG